MFALYESKLASNIFKPRDNHLLFSLRSLPENSDQDSEKIEITEISLREEEISAALRGAELLADLRVLYYLWSIRWLPCAKINRFCAERIDVGIESVPLPFTSETWSLIASAFGIPLGFLDCLVLHASIATEFTINSSQRGRSDHDSWNLI
jgi:hypothetical protein